MLRLFKIIESTQVCEVIKEDFSAYSYNNFPYFYYQNQATKTNNIYIIIDKDIETNLFTGVIISPYGVQFINNINGIETLIRKCWNCVDFDYSGFKFDFINPLLKEYNN